MTLPLHKYSNSFKVIIFPFGGLWILILFELGVRFSGFTGELVSFSGLETVATVALVATFFWPSTPDDTLRLCLLLVTILNLI